MSSDRQSVLSNLAKTKSKVDEIRQEVGKRKSVFGHVIADKESTFRETMNSAGIRIDGSYVGGKQAKDYDELSSVNLSEKTPLLGKKKGSTQDSVIYNQND